MNPELVPALVAARRRTTADAWRSAAQRFSTLASAPDAAAIEHVISGIPNPDAAWALQSALARDPQLPGVALGAAMVTVDQLTRDARAAFDGLLGAKVYCWALAKRERNAAGRPGKLHAKCAVIDDVALVGSANLTDDAFNRNMEMGLLVREPATVQPLFAHFQELISAGVLVRV